MMAEKARLFGDDKTLAKILAASTPREQKRLGREVQNFKEKLWKKKRFEIVVRGNVAKFQQNVGLRRKLLATTGKEMVEASSSDTIWGIGLRESDDRILFKGNWRGQNLLGKALDKARAIISNEMLMVEWFRPDFTAPFQHVDFPNTNFSTINHFLVAQKCHLFGDTNKLSACLQHGIDDLTMKVNNFSTKQWRAHLHQLMIEACAAKFTQNDQCQAMLLAASDSFLSDLDDKTLGSALCLVRDQIRKDRSQRNRKPNTTDRDQLFQFV